MSKGNRSAVRALLISVGSRGDIQPMIALAQGLRQAGYAPSLAGSDNQAGLVEKYGFEFQVISRQKPTGMDGKAKGQLQAGHTLRFGWRRLQMYLKDSYAINRAAWQACQPADLLIYRVGGRWLAVDSIAERLGSPCIKVEMSPVTRTVEFPPRDWGGRPSLGKTGNLLSYELLHQVIWQFFRRTTNEFRQRELELAAYPFCGPDANSFSQRLPLLYGFSPAILPRPGDWPDHVHITGYWELPPDPAWQPPPGLLDFIQAGPPPVYIGFGSMAERDTQATQALVSRALELCGQRGVVAWGANTASPEGAPSPERIFPIDYAPHDWLFPRMAAAVHHGGIGTTTASLKAGIPTVVVPFNYDQPFWGRRVAQLGAGPQPIPRRRLTAAGLAHAIQVCLADKEMRQKAQEIGRQIRAEQGVSRAVALIQEYLQK